MTSHWEGHLLVFSGRCFSLRVFVACFRSLSKWPHSSFLTEQPFLLYFPTLLFFFLFFLSELKDCIGIGMEKLLSSLRVVLQTRRWRTCSGWTDEVYYSFLVETSSWSSGTYKLFCSGVTISWTQQTWNRDLAWNMPSRYYFSHIAFKSTVALGEKQYLFAIRLKHFSNSYLKNKNSKTFWHYIQCQWLLKNKTTVSVPEKSLRFPFCGGQSKWSCWAVVLRHLLDSSYLHAFLSPILSCYPTASWNRLLIL